MTRVLETEFVYNKRRMGGKRILTALLRV